MPGDKIGRPKEVTGKGKGKQRSFDMVREQADMLEEQSREKYGIAAEKKLARCKEAYKQSVTSIEDRIHQLELSLQNQYKDALKAFPDNIEIKVRLAMYLEKHKTYINDVKPIENPESDQLLANSIKEIRAASGRNDLGPKKKESAINSIVEKMENDIKIKREQHETTLNTYVEVLQVHYRRLDEMNLPRSSGGEMT